MHLELSVIDPGLEGYYMKYDVGYNSDVLKPLRLECEGRRVRVYFDGCVLVEDYIFDDGFVRIARNWIVQKEGCWFFNTRMGIRIKDRSCFIPAVLYRNNDRGSGCFPKGPEAVEWDYSEERTPLPCCIMIYNDFENQIFFTEPADDSRFSASRSVQLEEDSVVVSTVIPGMEGPFSYRGKNSLIPAGSGEERACINISASGIPFEYTRSFYIARMEDGDLFRSYRMLLEGLGDDFLCSGNKNTEYTWSDYFNGKIENLLSLTSYDKKDGVAYLKMGRGNGELQDIYEYTSASFLVKSLEAAWIYADLALSCNNPEFLAYAEGIGRFFLNGEVAPGVHQDCFDLRTGEWGGYLGISENDEYRNLVNSRCNGESMSAYVRLYEALAAAGKELPEFLELPKRVALFYLENQLKNDKQEGSFGRWWAIDGQPVNTLGTNGAYVVSFLILMEPYFEDREKLAASIEAAGLYYKSLVDSGDFFGDTLDADAYDKESGAVLLSMFLDLFERSRDTLWLDYAVKAADYLLTWTWQYDSVFPPGTPLAKAGFHTTGMTSVSVAHHHLDFYGISIGYDFLRLWEFSGGDIYRKNGKMMIDACRQLVESGFIPKDRDGKSGGCQPEQINHTDWDYFNRDGHSKGYFDICISWVTVLGLGAWLKIEKRFPVFLKNEKGDL